MIQVSCGSVVWSPIPQSTRTIGGILCLVLPLISRQFPTHSHPRWQAKTDAGGSSTFLCACTSLELKHGIQGESWSPGGNCSLYAFLLITYDGVWAVQFFAWSPCSDVLRAQIDLIPQLECHFLQLLKVFLLLSCDWIKFFVGPPCLSSLRLSIKGYEKATILSSQSNWSQY